MERYKEMLLYEYLKEIQRFSHYPVIYQDPVSQNFMVKSGGTKQRVYRNMLLIKNEIDFLLKELFDEEAEDGIE